MLGSLQQVQVVVSYHFDPYIDPMFYVFNYRHFLCMRKLNNG